MYGLSLAILLLSLNSCFSVIELTNERIKALDEMVNTQMKKAKLKTVGLVIVNQTDVLHEKIYGGDNTITTKSPFVIGSVSKSFTALGILHLNISLKETLDKFDLKEYIDEKDAKEITVSELLNHTSGLGPFTSKRIHEKGYFNYSNQGYGLLGKIIEKKSKENYDVYMKEKIFGPAKMKDTFAKFKNEIIDSYINFLGFRSKYSNIKSDMGDNGFNIPAGFISSTIEDMGKYIKYYYLNPENEEYVTEMTNKTIPVAYKQEYGMGIIVQDKNGLKIYKHQGIVNSFLSLLTIYPDLKMGFFVVTNTRDSFCSVPADEFMNNIERFLLYDYYESISTNSFYMVHFALDVIYLLIIAIPLTYLIVTIVRKAKKTKYSWFIEIKGKIIFGLDVFFLIIIPLLIIFVFYFEPNLKSLLTNTKDFLFVIWTIFAIALLTFIIKLIYKFIYDKYFKKYERATTEDLRYKDLDRIEVEAND